MPPFQYDGYRNPYVGSLTDIIREPGQIRARAAELSGQAQARAVEQSGQAWAGAIRNIGDAASSAVQQATDQRRKLETLQLDETERRIKAARTVDELLKATPLVDLGDGLKGYDLPKLTAAMTEKGGDPAALIAHVGPVNEALQQFHQSRMSVVIAGAKGVQAAGNKPELADSFIGLLETNGIVSPTQAKAFREFATTPENVAALTAKYAGPPKLSSGAPGSVMRDDATGQIVPGSQVPERPQLPTRASLASDAANPASPTRAQSIAALEEWDKTPPAPKALQSENEWQVDGKSRPVIFDPGTGARYLSQEDVVAKRPIDPARLRKIPPASQLDHGDTTDLTPAGLDAAALNYAKTGILPPLGMGDKTTRKKIINRAAEMMPALDVASAKADFGANTDALKALVKQREALGAFESTALKNLDVFIEAAKKIPDTGSPFLNKPLRALTEAGLGGADLTAYNTARRTVIPEFAKILANPGLSGQLSDSARHEIEAVVSGAATLKQTIAAANILKQDTANRRTSYDDQIAGIQARLKKGSAPEPSAIGAKTDPMGIR